MLSERQLQRILRVFEGRMQGLTDRYIAIMGQHIRDIGKLSPSDANRLIQLKRANANIEKIKREIAKVLSADIKDIDKVFGVAAESDLKFASEVFAVSHTLSVKANKPLERILKAQLRITKQALANLSQTTLIPDSYRNAVDVAIQAVQSGVVDYNTAVRQALKQAAVDGLRVEYPNSGLTRRLDSAIRMNILDGVRAINRDVMEQIGKEFKADGIELSAHGLCAEDHLPYQGTQMSNKEFSRLQNRLDRPFGMWNCKHSWWPILLGVTKPAHSEEELRELAEYSNELITIDGRTKTRYQWTQEQRRLETAMRYQKDAANLYKESGDTVGRRIAQATINGLKDKYSIISEKAGLPEQPERAAVAGFRAVKTMDQLKNPEKYGIINTDDGKTYMRIYGTDGKEKYRYLQTDAIQKLDSSDAIAQYFTYTDKDGDTYRPIAKEFGDFKLDVQKEIAEGIEWARKAYNLDGLPLKITKGSLKNKAFAKYNENTQTLTFKNSLKKEESFVTAVHEMTHFADHMRGHIAETICEAARNNLKLGIKSKMYSNYAYAIAGKHSSKSEELLAYSLERYATRTSNPLANEIAKLFLERMRRK